MAFRAAEYERYSGERTNRPSWLPIAFGTIQRGWKSKWVRRVSVLSLVLGFGMMVMMYMINQVVPEWRSITEQAAKHAGQPAFKVDTSYYLMLIQIFVRPILLPLALLFGYDLIASDMRTNALEAYFSRPVTPIGYLTGRTLAFVSFLMLATFGPFFLVWLADIATAPNDEHFAAISHVPIGLFFALLLISLMISLMVQAVTSLTKSATWSNLVFVVIFLFFGVMGPVLYEITDHQQNMMAFSIINVTKVICGTFLGVDFQANGDHMNATPGAAFGVAIGVSAVSFLVIMRGLRKRSLV
ncbi:MAG: hypothetical protein GY747_04890 [Planctomycetes bacterium]|nr:hypothetical protein [Planctomycetota bacterium]MCP4770107.1 hypothetical protein [Planctomycetota bacterium]MCP4860745.1 hypothetical protein [Planctomycetota bacterium]